MRKESKVKSKKIKTILCGATIIGVVSLSGIFAYLTDTDKAANKFTVGSVKIELLEPKWTGDSPKEDGTPGTEFDTDGDGVPNHAENIVANQEIAKDPKIKNVGKNPAYVYLKIKVPKKSVKVVNDDGTIKKEKQEEEPIELFDYTINNKWHKIDTITDESTSTYNVHVYYYEDKLQPTPESDDESGTTESLFNSVKLVNLTEQDVTEGENLQIEVEAYAIQADSLPADTDAQTAYTKYVNQNKNE